MVSWRCSLAVAIWFFAGIPAGLSTTLFQEDFEAGLSKAWEEVRFQGRTQYEIHKQGTNSVLVGKAVDSASGLGHKVQAELKPGLRLSWRWKILRIPAKGSDTEIKTFDHAGRLFVAFKSRLGAPYTINYVWGNRKQVGETFRHPNSNRARFIVLQSGNARAGEWISESRDLAADWRLLFGKSKAPPIEAIGLMTDADGVDQELTAWYDDLLLQETPAAARAQE